MPRLCRRTSALVLALLLSLWFLPGCSSSSKRFEAQFMDVFDTVSTIVGYSVDKDAFTAQAEAVHQDLLEYHRLYDIYNDYSGINNLKTINDQAGKAPVKVDQRIIDLLLMAIEMDGQTGGKMNIAMGSVLSIWHDYRERGIDDPENARLPPMEDLRAAAEHTDIGQVIIDQAASTVYLSDPLMRLDVGSVAKGYATQRVCEDARKSGVSSLLVSIGGNVYAIGGKEGGQDWKVGVQDPKGGTENLLDGIPLRDASLVTSGDYQRYYTVDGKIYHHIIDPLTLMPADYFRAVTVLCSDSGKADALSTALFNLTVEDGKALLKNFPDAQALWVGFDDGITKSDGFPAI